MSELSGVGLFTANLSREEKRQHGDDVGASLAFNGPFAEWNNTYGAGTTIYDVKDPNAIT